MANEQQQQNRVKIEEVKAPVDGEKRFRVMEATDIPRGGSHYHLPRGKVLSSLGYDINTLKDQGVKLEELH